MAKVNCEYFVDDTNRSLLAVLATQFFTLGAKNVNFRGLCGKGVNRQYANYTTKGSDGKYYEKCPCGGDKTNKKCTKFMNVF